MAYYLIYLHITCAFLSLSLFIIRGMMQLTGKNWQNRKVLKILPHLTDTLLFCSGIGLFLLFQHSVTTWFICKIYSLSPFILALPPFSLAEKG
ncbi:hypothetical protein I927_02140 [Pasteurella multocida OH1905]|nr:hypothetical protein I927_02140 [Pasteurella multocida OH1905]